MSTDYSNLADKLFNALEDNVKAWLNSHALPEACDSKQLYDLMLRCRQELRLPPWHPVTGYFKAIAEGLPDKRAIGWSFNKGGRAGTVDQQLNNLSAERWRNVTVFREYLDGDADRRKIAVYDVERGQLWSCVSEQYIKEIGERRNLIDEIKTMLKRSPEATMYLYKRKHPMPRPYRRKPVVPTPSQQEIPAEEPTVKGNEVPTVAGMRYLLPADTAEALRSIIEAAEKWCDTATGALPASLARWKEKVYATLEF